MYARADKSPNRELFISRDIIVFFFKRSPTCLQKPKVANPVEKYTIFKTNGAIDVINLFFV